MRKLLFMLLCALSVRAFAQSEVAATVGVRDSSDVGESAPVPLIAGHVTIAVDLFDLSVGGSWRGLTKIGTSHGHQTMEMANARHWLGPNAFVDLSIEHRADRTDLWQKDTWSLRPGIGISALSHPGAVRGRPHRDQIGVAYLHEFHSSLSDCLANHVNGVGLQWQHDFPIHGDWFLRVVAENYWLRYAQNGRSYSGQSFSLSLGIVIRPRDQ